MSDAMTDVRTRPIVFSALMVRAILEGRKTMTRRVCKPQPGDWAAPGTRGVVPLGGHAVDRIRVSVCDLVCPYGQPGDALYVKERWGLRATADHYDGDPASPEKVFTAGQWLAGTASLLQMDRVPMEVVYGADAVEDDSGEREGWWVGERFLPGKAAWRNPRFMPKWAARLWLRVERVRVERLQDISGRDVNAEGYPVATDAPLNEAFANLWDVLNGKTYPWASNPWVWVVEFSRAPAPAPAGGEVRRGQ